ncbi:AAA family ATPase [Halocalculus aciditolerans]|uniref:ATPase n=1 Tax=Halocalculus aciditolerans TaxID=1383812 RepID=A0A830FF66_9EURY|nr:MoxR family ATPase [Halocalculus aciditolerans]GGL68901.1 ATPase [Halocalculus aciditolerans]
MTDATTEAAVERGVLSTDEAADLAARLVDNVETVIVGKRTPIEHLVVAVLGRGHVLLEDVPGTGKTMLARTVAKSVSGSFGRVQFTPDLLPGDVTGTHVFDESTGEFDFREGPVFGNVVLADEINRAPPKTQAALLEAMEEGQVTADGTTYPLPDPFIVIATMNAVERDRTYDLPLAEIDRFTKQLSLGYPSVAEEREILSRVAGDHPVREVEAVMDVPTLRRLRATAASVTVAEPVRDYVARLAADTREHAALGVSTRASIALLHAAQGRALLGGRDYVLPDDVQTEASSVLTHRVRADEGGRVGGPAAEQVVERALDRVRPE